MKYATEPTPIQLTPIGATPFALKCPCCGEPRLFAAEHTLAVADSGHWITDGDTILELHELLIATGCERDNPNPEDSTFWDTCNYACMCEFGYCPKCREDYFVIQASFIDEAVTVDRRFADTYFRHIYPKPDSTNFIASLNDEPAPGEWLVQTYETPLGVVMGHTLGPFHHRGAVISGPFGPTTIPAERKHMWEFSRDFLFDLWPTLKAAAVAANKAKLGQC